MPSHLERTLKRERRGREREKNRGRGRGGEGRGRGVKHTRAAEWTTEKSETWNSHIFLLELEVCSLQEIKS